MRGDKFVDRFNGITLIIRNNFPLFSGLRPVGMAFSPCPFIRLVKKTKVGKICEKTLLFIDTD
jgi:hypothetical protein